MVEVVPYKPYELKLVRVGRLTFNILCAEIGLKEDTNVQLVTYSCSPVLLKSCIIILTISCGCLRCVVCVKEKLTRWNLDYKWGDEQRAQPVLFELDVAVVASVLFENWPRNPMCRSISGLEGPAPPRALPPLRRSGLATRWRTEQGGTAQLCRLILFPHHIILITHLRVQPQ